MHLHTKLDRVSLLILAALGVPLACAVGPGGIDSTETGSGSGDGDGDPTTTSDSGTSGSESGDGDGDTGETGDTSGDPYLCEGAVPILQPDSGAPTGFVQCADGFVHRVEAVECTSPQAPDTPTCAEFPNVCGTAADCVDGPYASCNDDALAGCLCNYGCASDADCDDGFICACAGVVSDRAECIPAGCTTDASCGEGLCGLSQYEGCCDTVSQLACADPLEDCHVDADCEVDLCDPNWPDGGSVMHQCSYDGTGWACGAPGWCNCDCGRPFFVAGEARTAPLAARSDWALPAQLVQPDDARLRASLADYWAEVGRFEHASIASFARFALQLLALGAPPALIADTQAALADEIHHARLAFGLASAYADAPIGPGPLAVSACLADGQASEPRAILEGLIVEACVGETLAAIEAEEAASRARDPELARVLARIAADELRHAQLGWRALAWMLEQAEAAGDREVRGFALRTLAEAIAAVGTAAPASGRGPELREHGVLDDALRAAVRRAGCEAVLLPCAAALGSGARADRPLAGLTASA